jgi:two-component system, sensor histidine kinase and response regulator
MLPGQFNSATVNRLRLLWPQLAEMIGDSAVVLTSKMLNLPANTSYVLAGSNCADFLLLLSPNFSACLGIQSVTNAEHYHLNLIFAIDEIENFLLAIHKILPAKHQWRPLLKKWSSQLQPNDSNWQSQFTLRLIAALAVPPATVASTGKSPLSIVLVQQANQEKLLAAVVTNIRQLLDLPVILQTTVERVQNYLQVDRLMIYQFHQDTLEEEEILQRGGRVIHEKRRNDSLPTALNFSEVQTCFEDIQHWEHYQAGHSTAVSDVSTTYAQHPCFAEQMARLQVKAKLVVPIIVNNQLWGLLIAHDCQQCYEWQPWQQELLQQIAAHLAIAVYQSGIYSQLQIQKETLEQRVDKRTNELRDALIVAQAASAAKTEFLAVLSHELRTPLTSILGLSYTLLNLLNSNLDTRQKNYIEIIKNSGDHLLELIDDMLEMSKLEAGRAVLKISEFSLLKLLQQVVQMVQQRADLRQISIQIQIMDGAEDISQDHRQDVRFRGDTKRIKQILLNLLTNAIKFTEESGQIIIRTWREFDYLVLQVEDTGIGIAQDQIPRIFQKFQQLDSTLDRTYEGIGLGLALTKQLVELHGGWIEVESVENDGSTFTVWLASQALRLPKTEKVASLNKNTDDKQPTKTIVLVEENDRAGGMLADILTAAGYQVVSLTETYLAHKQIELWQPDLVIIDQSIGQDPTSQILNYLHNLTETQHIRYLLIATPDQQNSKEQAMAVDRLFWNRVQPEQLLHKISQII